MSCGDLSLDVTLNNTLFRRLNENPCDALFTDFKESLSNTSYDIFETVRNFEQLCKDQVDCLRHVMKWVREQIGYDRTVKLRRTMEAERCSWKLICTLFEDRLLKQPSELISNVALHQNLANVSSDKKLYELLRLGHKEFRELLLLGGWCEANAADNIHLDFNINFLSDKTVQWQHTLKHLVSKIDGDKGFVKTLDPDAVTRESGRRLNDLDVEDENRLMQVCFTYIRCGQLQKALELCVHCGQAWRAATLQGGVPYHDPNAGVAKEGDPLYNTEGNKNRRLWKKMCSLLSENTACPTTERAIYGVLCGNLSCSLLSCKTWADYFWAYCNAAAESIFSQQSDRRFEKDAMEADAGEPFCNLAQIFQLLQTCDNEIVRQESQDPFRSVQKFIALNQPGLAVEYMHGYIGSQEVVDNHVLRFMAHVVLVFSKLDLEFQKYFANGILEAYVASLIDERRLSLVSTYTSYLPEDLQVSWYSKCLEGVEEENERKFCLVAAEECGLDLGKICVAVVERAKENYSTASNDASAECSRLWNYPDSLDGDFSHLVSSFTSAVNLEEDEEKLIDSMRWLLFYDAHRASAIVQHNSIVRKFLIAHNLKAVKKLKSIMPADSLPLSTQIWLEHAQSTTIADDGQETYPELSVDHQNFIREYLSIVCYLDAVDAFSEWFDHFHRRKPKLPDVPTEHNPSTTEVSFVEKAGQEQRLQEYEINLNRWKKILDICTEKAAKSLLNVLLFPDGGWLHDKPSTSTDSDTKEDCQTEDDRTKCMKFLRQKYLPLISGMLIYVLKHTERYKDALQLADFIASEDRQLYKEFSQDQLRLLLANFSHCAIESLNAGNDCVGYEIRR